MTPFNLGVDFYNFERKGGRKRMVNPRIAYAIPQQGTAAIMKRESLGEVDDVMRDNGGRVILEIHDEFFGCFARKNLADTRAGVVKVMSREWPEMKVEFDGGRGLRIPVEGATGANWGEC